MSRKCPKGYSMSAQGVCTQSLGGDSTLAHGPQDCNECIDQCIAGVQHCSGAHSYPPGGCSCNRQCQDWGQTSTVCDGDPGDWQGQNCTSTQECLQYVYYCWGGDNCMDECYWECTYDGGGMGYSGKGEGGRGDWRKGGKIRRRR